MGGNKDSFPLLCYLSFLPIKIIYYANNMIEMFTFIPYNKILCMKI